MESEAPVCQKPTCRAGPRSGPLLPSAQAKADTSLPVPLAARLPGRQCRCTPDISHARPRRGHHPCTDVRSNTSPETETRHSGSAASAARQASVSQWGGASTEHPSRSAVLAVAGHTCSGHPSSWHTSSVITTAGPVPVPNQLLQVTALLLWHRCRAPASCCDLQELTPVPEHT